jgi:quercetin dioxygenase-like cupin family protein
MTQGRSYLAGLVTGVVVTAAVGVVGMSVAAARAAQAPAMAKASEKMTAPAVKVLLENSQVRVREVTFAPGTGDTHTHPYAHVGVILTKGQLAFQNPGEKEEVVSFEAGSVGFREAKVTHLARNPGTVPMKVIEVEVK